MGAQNQPSELLVWKALMESAFLGCLVREYLRQRLTISDHVDAIESTRHSSQRQPPLLVSIFDAM